VVVIEADHIRAAGPAASVAVPAGTTTIELGGKTVVPGLVVDHTHVGMADGTSASHKNYTRAVSSPLRSKRARGLRIQRSLRYPPEAAVALTR